MIPGYRRKFRRFSHWDLFNGQNVGVLLEILYIMYMHIYIYIIVYKYIVVFFWGVVCVWHARRQTHRDIYIYTHVYLYMAHMKSCPQTFTVGHHLFRTGVQPWDLPQPRSSERIFESLFDDTIQLQCPLANGLVSASPGVYFAKKSVLVSILVENREQRHGWSPLSELIRLPNEQWTTFLVLKTILEDSCFRFVSRTGSLFWVATWINPNVFWDVALTHFFFLGVAERP